MKKQIHVIVITKYTKKKNEFIWSMEGYGNNAIEFWASAHDPKIGSTSGTHYGRGNTSYVNGRCSRDVAVESIRPRNKTLIHRRFFAKEILQKITCEIKYK